MIEIICPKCNKNISLQTAPKGQIIHCPECFQEVTLTRNGQRKTPVGDVPDSEQKVSILKKLRGYFQFEWAWRSFVVSQILGLLVIVYVDWTASPNLYPSGGLSGLTIRSPGWDFFMDFFDLNEWGGRGRTENRISFVCIFGPFLVWKSTDWIASSNKDEKRQPGE